MKRKRFPVKANENVKRISIDEIMEGLNNSEKAKVLANGSNITAGLFNLKKEVYHIGECLYENKKILPHGLFTPWIELTFGKDLPYKTAYFYMRIYEVFKEHPTTIQYIPQKYLLMVTGKQFPDEIVRLLNENPDKIDKTGLQKISELNDLFKTGTLGGSQFLKLAKEEIKLGMDILKGRTKHRLNSNMRLSLQFGAGDMLTRIKSLRKTASEMAGVFPYDPNSPEHKKLMNLLEETIKGLQGLKSDLEGGGGFWKPTSTEDGDKFV